MVTDIDTVLELYWANLIPVLITAIQSVWKLSDENLFLISLSLSLSVSHLHPPRAQTQQSLQSYTPESTSTAIANQPENRSKNRYPDALPCES